jgi:hypothetical protein
VETESKRKRFERGRWNTKYFHLKASGRKKKNHISVLHHNGEEILGETELIKHVTEFYKKLFGPSPVTSLRLDGVICNQLSEEDRQSLIKPFSLEEIKEIVDDLKHDKAAGPDSFPAEFYQKFWDYIKYDLKEMLDKFHSGQLNIERLNHGVISLIPKVHVLMHWSTGAHEHWSTGAHEHWSSCTGQFQDLTTSVYQSSV